MIRDDGAVVYLNGHGVWRSNMPTGTIGYNTLSADTHARGDESAGSSDTRSRSLLVTGTNVIAVEIHQAEADSSDISFDFQLIGVPLPAAAPPAARITVQYKAGRSRRRTGGAQLSLNEVSDSQKQSTSPISRRFTLPSPRRWSLCIFLWILKAYLIGWYIFSKHVHPLSDAPRDGVFGSRRGGSSRLRSPRGFLSRDLCPSQKLTRQSRSRSSGWSTSRWRSSPLRA